MTGNNTRSKLLKNARPTWESFDRSPRWYKEIIWNGVKNFTAGKVIRDGDKGWIEASLAKLGPQLALEAYGPDHPAAQSAVAAQKDLGF